MKISVAMCTYNGAEYLHEQLASIAAQTQLPDELVVCDDCSTDATVEIARNFALTAPFPVRLYVNEINLRSTKNFEKAISLCKGDIIALSDQDDVWLPEKLRMFEAEFLKGDNVGLVFCDGDVVDENLKSLDYTNWQLRSFEGERYKQFFTGNAFKVLREANFISGCMMAFHAKFKELVLPIPTGLPYLIHDYWIALLLTAISKAVSVSLPLVKYRQHRGQQIGIKINKLVNEPVSTYMPERAQRKPDYSEELLRMTAIEQRLAAFSDTFPCRDVLSELNQYVTHMKARTALQNKQAARVPTVLREFVSLRYHRYSNGTASAIKDLIL